MVHAEESDRGRDDADNFQEQMRRPVINKKRRKPSSPFLKQRWPRAGKSPFGNDKPSLRDDQEVNQVAAG